MQLNPTNSMILAVDTSGRQGSIAIGTEDDIIAHANFSAPMKHNAELFVKVEEILNQLNKKPTDISQIYIAAGPGSFTGLRIAVTLAKMAAYAADVKIVPISTLDCIAQNVYECIKQENIEINRIATILDAKRKQFFYAIYEKNNNKFAKTDQQGLITAEDFKKTIANKQKPIHLLGEGLVFYKNDFKTNGIEIIKEKYWQTTAKNIYKLGRQSAKQNKFTKPENLTPFYMRAPDAIVKKTP